MLKDMSLGDSAQDELEWALDKSKNFTTKSLYRFLNHRGVIIANSKNMWKTKLPLKVKIFVWQLSNNKLQEAVSLKKRGWKGDIHCCLCEGGVENVDLIFFGCSIAQFVWCCICTSLGWSKSPTSWSDLQGGWSSSGQNFPCRLQMFMFAGLAWGMWRSRNKMAIEKKVSSNPLGVIRSGINFVQKWSPKLKEPDQELLAKVLDRVQVWLGSFRLSDAPGSDIMELC
jgi:hypothetical protein